MIGMIGQSQYTESKMDQPLTFQGPTKEYRIKNIIILIDFLVILVSLAVSALISLPPSLINQIINLKVLFSLVSYYNKIIWFIGGECKEGMRMKDGPVMVLGMKGKKKIKLTGLSSPLYRITRNQ